MRFKGNSNKIEPPFICSPILSYLFHQYLIYSSDWSESLPSWFLKAPASNLSKVRSYNFWSPPVVYLDYYSRLIWAVKTFPELWYCTALVGHTTTRTSFKVEPVRMYTIARSALSLLEAPEQGFFWNLSEFRRRIRFNALYRCEKCPLEGNFQSREQPEVTGSEIQRVRWLGDDTTSQVWLGALSWSRGHCPCLPLPLPHLQVEMTRKRQSCEISFSYLTMDTYCHVYGVWLRTGFGLVIGFIALCYTSQITVDHTGPSQPASVITSRCLISAFNEIHFPFPWARELSLVSVPTFHSSSQWLYRSSPLTN
jgi:hypothetical protein